MSEENKIMLYQDDNEITHVSVRSADEDLWLTQNQLVEIYQTSKSNVSEHIKHIFEDRELDKNVVVRKFRITTQHGAVEVKTQSRDVAHYNLDMVIALGYRVQSQVATRFRGWATQRLHEYIQKGFTMDDERLKQGGNRYFHELLQRIRDIRSSERNFYQQVTDIYATATDYDQRDEITKMFFATVQNKLHYAVHENTAAEVIYNRVDNEKPFVGMTNFKGNYVTKDNVKIAKNYLSEIELQRLNLLVSGFLDFAEFQALEMNPMTMKGKNEIIALDRAYINYAKFEELTEKDVVYVTKMKKNLTYETLVDCMYQNENGLMEYREQVVVFRKDGINHIARIITYVDIKKGKKPKLISLLTNDFDMPLERLSPYIVVGGRLSRCSSR